MGHGAQANRRALIEMVQDCITQANTMTTLATDVREANNKLATQTGEDVAALTKRLDTLSAWCKRNEARADRAHERTTALRSEAAAFLTSLTFRERFRWVFLGRVPLRAIFAGYIQTPPNASAPDPTLGVRAGVSNHGLSIQPLKGDGPLTGYIPHTSRGPAVLP